jgi:hypothetical protein
MTTEKRCSPQEQEEKDEVIVQTPEESLESSYLDYFADEE